MIEAEDEEGWPCLPRAEILGYLNQTEDIRHAIPDAVLAGWIPGP